MVRSRLSPVAARRCDGRDCVARFHGAAGRAHGCAGEYAGRPQHGGMHALLVLPVARARLAACLVQVGAVSFARGDRSARRARGVRRGLARRHGDSRMGFDGGSALSRAADAPCQHGHAERSGTRRSRHARFDDRHGTRARAGRSEARKRRPAMNGAQDMGGMQSFGPVAPETDEPYFHADWERRALALTIAMGSTGKWNIDMSRAARESLPPAQYLSSSYYEIWFAGLC